MSASARKADFTDDMMRGLRRAHWLEIAPEHLDPFMALWSMCDALRRDRLPGRRIVIRFDFTGRPRERYWLLIEFGDTEICKTHPGFEEDLYITAEAKLSSNGMPANLPGSKPPARAAPNSTARRR
jgi:hypothetical protein